MQAGKQSFHFQMLQLCCLETFSVSCSPFQPIHIFVSIFTAPARHFCAELLLVCHG